jgi:hypothetical protein
LDREPLYHSWCVSVWAHLSSLLILRFLHVAPSHVTTQNLPNIRYCNYGKGNL